MEEERREIEETVGDDVSCRKTLTLSWRTANAKVDRELPSIYGTTLGRTREAGEVVLLDAEQYGI